ncbi:hypothetical protein ACJ2CR_02580 [Myxococcus faecalis]|uniref:hypothetical protein n=1 Tax=Myxococcus faecalis TaxID=3115646 RepID=UPI0038D05E84
MAWRAGDPVRVVIHSFKDFRDKHVEALKKAVLDVAGSEFKVDFAFVHIVEKHPLLVFDPGQRQRIPPRGVVVRLGNSEALVAVQGPTEVRREARGFPRPVCVKVHRSSTFTDLEYLSWQALAFSALSWRNVPPPTAPVTIQYAKWIADQPGRRADGAARDAARAHAAHVGRCLGEPHVRVGVLALTSRAHREVGWQR